MRNLEDEIGKRIHCRELSSGKYYTGVLLITDKEITVDLFAYDERYIEVDDEAPLHLQTQNQSVVSLHSNYSSQSGTVFRRSKDARRQGLYHSQISSSIAVIGPDPWLGTDTVKSVQFEISETDFVFRHTAKLDQVAASTIGSEIDRGLFIVEVDGLTIRANYSSTYSIRQPFPIKSFATLSIDFSQERTLYTYLQDVIAVTELFAASSSLPLTPEKIQVFRRTLSELASGNCGADYMEPYHVIYLWPQRQIDKTNVWPGSSFLLSTDDVEVDGLKACLIAWIKRWPQWKKANALMMASLMSSHEISPSRFLNACRWFEEIPLTASRQAISTKDIQLISDAAASKAVEIGYGSISGRIIGSLKRIAGEAQRDRFVRLLNSIREKFSFSVLDDAIVEDLMRAMDLRGKAAHGHIGSESNEQHRLFVRSLFALEAFCFLLTVKDLPMSDEGKRRAGANPVVQQYRHV